MKLLAKPPANTVIPHHFSSRLSDCLLKSDISFSILYQSCSKKAVNLFRLLQIFFFVQICSCVYQSKSRDRGISVSIHHDVLTSEVIKN